MGVEDTIEILKMDKSPRQIRNGLLSNFKILLFPNGTFSPTLITLSGMSPKPAAKRKRASRKAKPKTKGFDPLDCKLGLTAEPIRSVVDRVEKVGGAVVGQCK